MANQRAEYDHKWEIQEARILPVLVLESSLNNGPQVINADGNPAR